MEDGQQEEEEEEERLTVGMMNFPVRRQTAGMMQ
jgi:hypothetical protein